VRVTASPRPGQEPAQSTDTYYATALRHAQLRLSLSIAVAFLGVVTVLVLAAASWPLLEDLCPAGLPLSWWLIGVALYPLVLGAAVLYRGAARRLERRYARVSGR